MSNQWPGGLITKNSPVPAGTYQNSAASGIWTLDQVAYWVKQSLWPIPGNVNPEVFIESLFSTYLYTGNNATQTITNGIDLAGSGGMIWFKPRNVVASHVVFDTVRGPTKFVVPSSSSFGELTNTVGNDLTSFNSNGFSLGPAQTGSVNASGTSQVAWTFRKKSKFFDVVTYTGNGVDPTNIPHNLGSVPGCIIIKCTSTGATDWFVYHRSLGNSKSLNLNQSGIAESGTQIWGTTTPTSTVFTVGNINANTNGRTYVAYLFAHDAGGFGLSGNENVISCGSYTGVTYPDSLEVTLGFEPQWVMIKNATTASGWAMWDVMRGMSVIPAANTAQALLLEPNTSAAESNQPGIYPTPTGFVVKNGLTSISGTGDTITYIAIRRGPMAVPTLGTSVFAPFNTSVTSNPQSFTTNFPVDFIFTRKSNGAAEQVATSRLQGGRALDTTLTSIEQTASYFQFDSNTSNSSTYFNTGFGTVQSMDSFRRAPGFLDVVCYTGTGANRTVAHNLAAVPELMIFKTRTGTARAWGVYSAALGNTGYLFLNDPSNSGTSTTFLNSTSPTSSVISLGSQVWGNQTGSEIVAYLFATCAGVSKVGSYTGTGTTLAINCNFTAGARYVLIKRTDATGDWYVWDSARGIVAGNDPYLLLNSTAAEVTGTDYIDTSAAGFEITSTAPAEINASGGSFIFLAIS